MALHSVEYNCAVLSFSRLCWLFIIVKLSQNFLISEKRQNLLYLSVDPNVARTRRKACVVVPAVIDDRN